MHSFTILAVKDISQSDFAQAERIRGIETAGRNVELDQEEHASGSVSQSQPSSTRCLKFVLSPLNGGGTQQFVTAFELDGPIPTDMVISDLDSFEGAILDINVDVLEVARDTILLRRDRCRIRPAQTGSVERIGGTGQTNSMQSNSTSATSATNHTSHLAQSHITFDEDEELEMLLCNQNDLFSEVAQ